MNVHPLILAAFFLNPYKCKIISRISVSIILNAGDGCGLGRNCSRLSRAGSGTTPVLGKEMSRSLLHHCKYPQGPSSPLTLAGNRHNPTGQGE